MPHAEYSKNHWKRRWETSTAAIKRKKNDPYFELVLEFLLRPFRNEKELRATSAMLDRLLDNPQHFTF
jgi:hypothetical protein